MNVQSSVGVVFRVGDNVVYPSHGVGTIISEESQVIGGIELSLYVISFSHDKMTLMVPKERALKAGLRHLSSNGELDRAVAVLRSKARVSRGMWSKRAQEYEGKINSGNVVMIAEVLRDLHKNVDDPNRSYSEKLIYELAFNRFVNEYAMSADIDVTDANKKVATILDYFKD